VDKRLISTAHQTSPFPCSSNTITVHFMANFVMPSGTVLSLTGLTGATAVAQLSLSDGSGGSGHERFFRDDTTWNQDASTLTFTVKEGTNLMAQKEYSISFEVANPNVELDAEHKIVQNAIFGATPETLILFSGGLQQLQVSAVNNMQLSEVDTKLGLCGNVNDNDAHPMFVYEPKFTIAALAQSSDLPCDTENMITVTLKTNMPLCAGSCHSQITIGGLSNAILADGPVELVPVSSSDSDQDDVEVFSSSPHGTPGYGHWSQQDQSLTLFLVCCMECNMEYKFKFRVKNPDCQQDAPSVYIGPYIIHAENSMNTHTMSSPVDEIPMQALSIVQPKFSQHSMHSTSERPCDTNTFSITLASNIPIKAQTKITVHGLSPTASSPDQVRKLAGAEDYVSFGSLPYLLADDLLDESAFRQDEKDLAGYAVRKAKLEKLNKGLKFGGCNKTAEVSSMSIALMARRTSCRRRLKKATLRLPAWAQESWAVMRSSPKTVIWCAEALQVQGGRAASATCT